MCELVCLCVCACVRVCVKEKEKGRLRGYRDGGIEIVHGVLRPRIASNFCDLLTWPHVDFTAPSFLQIFELFSTILKYFPGPHREIYKNLQEVNRFIGHRVEKHRETLDPSNPRDFIDTFLLRMDKVRAGGREGIAGEDGEMI